METVRVVPVSLAQLLEAREQRVARQQAALTEYGKTVLSLTLVSPGPVKDSPSYRFVFAEALVAIDTLLVDRAWQVVGRQYLSQPTGQEALLVVDCPAQSLKWALALLEDEHPLGRLWDIDVICPETQRAVSRTTCCWPRENAWCAARRGMPAPVRGRIRWINCCWKSRRRSMRIAAAWPKASCHPGWTMPDDETALAADIAHAAYTALIKEVELTPKPGLVDRFNTGAHRDMDLSTFYASAKAIAPWFSVFFRLGLAESALPPAPFLPHLRADGRACESAMFGATGGVNTHKGSIFSLGLLCAAAGRLVGVGVMPDAESMCREVAALCAGLVGDELTPQREARTAGELLFQRYRLTAPVARRPVALPPSANMDWLPFRPRWLAARARRPPCMRPCCVCWLTIRIRISWRGAGWPDWTMSSHMPGTCWLRGRSARPGRWPRWPSSTWR